MAPRKSVGGDRRKKKVAAIKFRDTVLVMAGPGEEAPMLLGRAFIDDSKELRRGTSRIEALGFRHIALERTRKLGGGLEF